MATSLEESRCVLEKVQDKFIVSVTVNDTWFISIYWIYCVAGFANSLATFSNRGPEGNRGFNRQATSSYKKETMEVSWALRVLSCGAVDPKDMSEILT